MRRTVAPACVAVLGTVLLSGCLQLPGALAPAGTEVARQSPSFAQPETEAASAIITALQDRRSILDPASPPGIVARAALDASARSTEAELRAAKLRAEAKAKNWLPTLGPSISLTSLGDLVASLLVEQVLFDNGHRKAEREFAAADVEVAAVNLSIDVNTRVETAVALHVRALRGDESAELNRRALARMGEFLRIVRGRVAGGVSERADLRVVEGKMNDLRAALAAAEEAAVSARRELAAMTGTEVPAAAGPPVLTAPGGIRPLAVLLAEAEAGRSVAEARMARASLLPQIAASGSVTGSGITGQIGAALGQPLGFGTPAALRAVEAAADAADRSVAEAEEDARRALARQEQRLASYRRQEAEAAALAEDSRTTFLLFEAQFRAGQRSVMEVVSLYEQLVEREETHIAARYEVVLIQLEMARDMGLLADGDAI